MTRAEIEADWPLVVKHRDAVLRFLEFRRTATQRKLSRTVVLDDYDRLRDVLGGGRSTPRVAVGHSAHPRRACRAARRAESGTLRVPRPRRTGDTHAHEDARAADRRGGRLGRGCTARHGARPPWNW